MARNTISAPVYAERRSRRRRVASRSRRFLLTAAALSVAFHLAAALLIVLLPHVVPQDARPQEEGAVELLMVEKQGARPSISGQQQEDASKPLPQNDKPVAREMPPTEPDPDETAGRSVPARPVDEAATESLPKHDEEQQQEADAKTKSEPDSQPPAQAPKAPVFDLAGTESESNAEVLGGRVIPASPDNRFRNRPPIYPREAAMRGEHGAVILVIHVSETGVATGADVMETSGVASLDKAAIDAVLKWHFRPALQEGRAVPFVMRFRFIFDSS